jgi:transcriptional regulator with XRE-family HTH domain
MYNSRVVVLFIGEWLRIMKIDYEAIGKRVRNEREKKSMSQMRLAELSNLSVNSISHIECGNTKFSLPSIVAIANALDVTIDCLMMDVVNNSHIQFKKELVDIFDSCTNDEYTLLVNICKTTLETYRNLKNK